MIIPPPQVSQNCIAGHHFGLRSTDAFRPRHARPTYFDSDCGIATRLNGLSGQRRHAELAFCIHGCFIGEADSTKTALPARFGSAQRHLRDDRHARALRSPDLEIPEATVDLPRYAVRVRRITSLSEPDNPSEHDEQNRDGDLTEDRSPKSTRLVFSPDWRLYPTVSKAPP